MILIILNTVASILYNKEYIRVWVVLVIEDANVTAECRTANNALLRYFIVCLSVMQDSLLC